MELARQPSWYASLYLMKVALADACTQLTLSHMQSSLLGAKARARLCQEQHKTAEPQATHTGNTFRVQQAAHG